MKKKSGKAKPKSNEVRLGPVDNRRLGKATGLKEKILSLGSSVSGLMGVFSSYAVCHTVCTAAIALLAIIGIIVTGMPLLFLQSVAVPFWTAAVILFAVLLFLKLRKMGCLSGNMLTLNAGLIVFATPLQPLQQFSLLFRVAGSALILAAAVMLIGSRIKVRVT